MVWGALLSGGLSLLGGLGARQSAKSQQRQADARAEQSRLQNAWTSAEMLENVPKRIAGDAEVAGFNPVTWLQGGALGYYTNAYQMRMTSPGQTVPIPSMMSAFADAGSAALNAFRSDARYEDTKSFQSSQLDKQLSAIRPNSMRSVELRPGQSALGMGTASAPSMAVSGPTGPVGGGLSFNTHGWKGVEQTQVYEGIRPSGLTPDAQKTAGRYGEVVGDTQGVVNFFGDITNSDGKGTWWDTLKRGMNYQPFGGAPVGRIRDLNSPFRNPNSPPGYYTGGGFGGGDWMPFSNAGGF